MSSIERLLSLLFTGIMRKIKKGFNIVFIIGRFFILFFSSFVRGATVDEICLSSDLWLMYWTEKAEVLLSLTPHWTLPTTTWSWR